MFKKSNDDYHDLKEKSNSFTMKGKQDYLYLFWRYNSCLFDTQNI
jgi:hypothetical protein